MRCIPVFLLTIFFSLHTLQAEIYHVPAQYNTIQTAYNNCNSGDTILVAPGSYEENLVFTSHPVCLTGNILYGDTLSMFSTILCGNPATPNTRIPVTIQGPFPVAFILQGFVIRDGNHNNGYGGGLQISNTEFILQHNVITSNSAARYAGAWIHDADGIVQYNKVTGNNAYFIIGGMACINGRFTIRFNQIEQNRSITYQTGGLYTSSEDTVTIYGNRFLQNDAYAHYGAANINYGIAFIDSNFFIGNTAGEAAGLTLHGVEFGNVTRNVFEENRSIDGNGHVEHWAAGGAFYALVNDSLILSHNTFRHNAAEWSGGAIYFGSNCVFHHNRFMENQGVFGSVIEAVNVNSCLPVIYGYRNLFQDNLNLRAYSDYDGAIRMNLSTVMTLTECDFIDNNRAIAISPFGGSASAIGNYWGDPTGPYHSRDNPDGLGDTVSTAVPVLPFSAEHFWAPNLDLDRTFLQFGVVPIDSVRSMQIYFRNGGVEELLIHDIWTENPVFSVDLGGPQEVAEGDSVAVMVTFTPDNETIVMDSLYVLCNDPSDTLQTIPMEGEGWSDDLPEDENSPPNTFSVSAPAPNPFNVCCRIQINMPVTGELKLVIADILGREVRTITNRVYHAGSHEILVSSAGLPSGIYFLMVVSPDESTHVRKLVVLK